MNHTFIDLVDYQKLDMVYNQIRVLQSKHNQLETKCIGSGKCCKVGLRLHFLECANIAFMLKREFYLIMEDKGERVANEWWDTLIARLKNTFKDESWEPEGSSEKHCVFYRGGCTIYEYRPLVCRSYGVITTVDSFCPRSRNADGLIDVFKGNAVKKIIEDFISIYKDFGARNPEKHFSISFGPT